LSAIVDVGLTRFQKKREENVVALAAAAYKPLLRHAEKIDFVIVANSYSGELNLVSGINNHFTSHVSLDKVRSLRADNISGSGGTAIFMADTLIKAKVAQTVLVIGVEKMSDKNTAENAEIISTLLTERERESGVTLPSLAALMAKSYMQEYNADREAIAWVAVKSHKNGSLNQYAHYQKETSIQQVMNSAIVADPLRAFEYSPISDGAAALLITSNENAIKFTPKPVFIKAIGFAADTSHLTFRDDFTSIEAVREAGKMAYSMANVKPKDIGFAELHDMATILEIVQSEDLQLFDRGQGWHCARDGTTAIDGQMPINTSGGLISKGHPIGASGVAQATEAFFQIRGEAGARQVKSNKLGLSISLAGFGNNATVIVYGDSE